MRQIRLLRTVSLLVTLLLAACGPAPTPTPSPTPAATPASAANRADIQNFAFNPQTITVPVGTTVTWTNLDGAAHTVSSTSAPEGKGFDSGLLNQEGSFPLTFTVPGTYEYQCNIHPFMKGTIVVTE